MAAKDSGKVLRHHKWYPKSEAQLQYLKSNKQIENFVFAFFAHGLETLHTKKGKADDGLNPISEKVEFTEALGMLHKDLMTIQIENPNFQ